MGGRRRGRGRLRGRRFEYPKVLRAVYGDRLRSLQQLVLELLGPEEKGDLVQKGDPAEYEALLNESYASIPDDAPVPGPFSLEQRWTQLEIVERVIQLQFRQNGKPAHVLCFGYQQLRPGGSYLCPPSRSQNLECVFRNTIMDAVISQSWCILHSRVGDTLMLYLLSHAAIFTALPNRCYMQVSGSPINLSASAGQRRISQQFLRHCSKEYCSSIHPTGPSEEGRCSSVASSLQMDKPKQDAGLPVSLSGRKRKADFGSEFKKKTKAVKEPSSTKNQPYILKRGAQNEVHSGDSKGSGYQRSSVLCDGQSPGCSIQDSQDLVSRKRIRLFSWQRRKKQKVADVGTLEESDVLKKTLLSRQVSQASVQGEEVIAFITPHKLSENAGGLSETPRRLVDRGQMFYSTSFSCKTGLPGSRSDVLLNTKATSTGAATLFEAIFGNPPNSTTPKDTKSLRYPLSSLRHLKELILNAKRFQCGHLLRRHCPIPAEFYEEHTVSDSENVVTSNCFKEVDLKLDIKDMFLDEGYGTQGEEEGDGPFCSCRANHDLLSTRGPSTSCEHKNVDGFAIDESEDTKKRLQHHNSKVTKTDSKISLPELLKMSTAHHEVVAFLWAVCRRIVPEELLGLKRNWRILRKHFAHFVGLRRYEVFSSQQCLHKLKLSEFPFVSQRYNGKNVNGVEHNYKQIEELGYSRVQMLEDWLFWLFNSLLVPLVRTHFYVTESENQRQNVVYFRKPLWSRIQSLALHGLSRTVYKRVNPNVVLRNRGLGFSKVRLLPKRTGIRPIANLGSASMYVVKRKDNMSADQQEANKTRSIRSKRMSGDQVIIQHHRKSAELNCYRGLPKHQIYSFRSVNSALGDAHQCLKFEQEMHPEYLGASIFGYNDIYLKLLPFIQRLRSCSGGIPQLFLAVCDVANAFDTISHERLFKVIHLFLQEQQYLVVRFSSVSGRLASVRVLHERACTPVGRHQNFLEFVTSLTVKRSETIFTDQVSFANISRDQLLRILDEHINRNILHVGSHFFQPVTGIPQGSVLSSLLCALYYGHLDANYILPLLQRKLQDSNEQITPRFLTRHTTDTRSILSPSTSENSMKRAMETEEQSILLRLVDDSLFISTSKLKASIFLNIMHTGLKEFGCFANEDKTAANFDLNIGDKKKNLKSMYQTEDGACYMRWGGLLINCHTLETQADYTRYCGEHIKASLTVMRSQHQGLNLVMKMFQFMRPKCHPVFYDSAINSASTTCLNAYQAFMLCAMKFHAYMRSLVPITCSNPQFLLQAICRTTRYMFRLIQQRMQSIGKGKVLVHARELEWLGLSAFGKVLSKKQSTHRSLLLLIHKELKLARYKGLSCAAHLVSATDEKRSSMFKYISTESKPMTNTVAQSVPSTLYYNNNAYRQCDFVGCSKELLSSPILSHIMFSYM